MLKILRKKGVMRKLLWMLAGVIILAFGFLGQAYRLNRSRSQGIAGRLHGRAVPMEDFQHHFEQIHLQAVMQYGQNLQKILPYLDLESQTWDRIIALHEAERRKIRIDDQEVVQAIQGNPLFQKEGRFNNMIYKNVLFALRLSAREYEEGLRESLKITRLFEQVTKDLAVSEQETLERFKSENEKIQTSYIFFPDVNYTDQVLPDPDAIRTYYEGHKADFIQPPSINVTYLSLPYPEEASPDDKDAVLEQALEIAMELQEKPEITAYAKSHDLELQTTGFFSMEQPILKQGWSFSEIQQLFQNQVGFISHPIETPQGIDILQITGQKEAEIPDYTDIEQQVGEVWTQAQARLLAKQHAETVSEEIRNQLGNPERSTFVQFAKDRGLEVSQTPVFTRGEYLPKLGPAKTFKTAAFNLEPERPISDVVETDKGYAILHLDSKIPVDIQQFQEQKQELAQEIRSQKATEKFNDFIAQLRQAAHLEDNIARLMEEQKKNQQNPDGQNGVQSDEKID